MTLLRTTRAAWTSPSSPAVTWSLGAECAAPLAGANPGTILDLRSTTPADIQRSSQAFINDSDSYADAPEAWTQRAAAVAEVDAAADEALPFVRENPGSCVPDPPTPEDFRTDVRTFQGSGGTSEPTTNPERDQDRDSRVSLPSQREIVEVAWIPFVECMSLLPGSNSQVSAGPKTCRTHLRR